MNAPHDADGDPEDNPIAELQQILDDAGSDIARIFGPALTIFAGPSAPTKDDKQKLAELERLVTGP